MNIPVCDIMTCDEIVRNFLPQLRAELVCRLVESRGIPQAKVARWMGISRAAVSQYMSRKRGTGDIRMTPALDRIIESWADGVITGEGSVTICDICRCIHEIKPDFNISGNIHEDKIPVTASRDFSTGLGPENKIIM